MGVATKERHRSIAWCNCDAKARRPQCLTCLAGDAVEDIVQRVVGFDVKEALAFQDLRFRPRAIQEEEAKRSLAKTCVHSERMLFGDACGSFDNRN